VKRLLLSASLVTLLTGVAAANPTPAPHVAFKVAPADEYFGRLKMSILGIRNTIKDEGLKIDSDISQGATVVKSCAYTEDALHDWEKKYPQDSWIPHTLFVLERVYAKVDSDEARAKAKATMLWLVHDFPRSPDGKVGKVELAQNKVGVKPIVADAAPPTPSPAPLSTP
jgi:hypothetical protein